VNASARQQRMSVDDYVAWAAAAERGRHELVDGVPCAMSPERVVHTAVKTAVVIALDAAVKRSGLRCFVFADGVSIRTGERTVREPDATVQCTPVVDRDSIFLDAPMIVVEVVSPSSARTDTITKTSEYFGVPSIVHYLVVLPEEGLVLHHQRAEGGAILTRFHRDGSIRLDPPGIDLPLADIIAAGTPEPGAGADEGTL
jgi:Uma2 family endonuclease